MRLILICAFGMLLLPMACSNKKMENNIRSLERRVAALERKHEGAVLGNNQPVGEQIKSTALPAISFENTEYDFGAVDEGTVVEHTFTFTNTGMAPLVIQKATATCGCTVPSWPKDPIPAGGKGEIEVKFDSKNRRNLQTKYVTITANTQPAQVRLKISGRVDPIAE
jgi:hypothetical protein